MTRLSLLIKEWPTDWQCRWHMALKPADDVFGDDGLGAHWAPDTRKNVRKRLELYFGYLTKHNMLDHQAPLGALLTEQTLRPWIGSLQEGALSPVTIYGYVRDIRRGIAVMDPTVDTSFALMVARRLESRAKPTRDKHKDLVPPLELYRAGLNRMDRVETSNYEKEDMRAVQYGDGLAMAIAMASTIRLKNLAGIRIGKNLKRVGDHYRLVFEAGLMKSRRPFAIDLLADLTCYIDRYIRRHRRKLLGDNESDQLFISCYRRPMSQQSMYCRFRAATKLELGKDISPHRVRDLAVTYLATDHPDNIAIATPLLNHARQHTCRDHYNQASQISAGKDYLAAIDQLRTEAIDALDNSELFDTLHRQ